MSASEPLSAPTPASDAPAGKVAPSALTSPSPSETPVERGPLRPARERLRPPPQSPSESRQRLAAAQASRKIRLWPFFLGLAYALAVAAVWFYFRSYPELGYRFAYPWLLLALPLVPLLMQAGYHREFEAK